MATLIYYYQHSVNTSTIWYRICLRKSSSEWQNPLTWGLRFPWTSAPQLRQLFAWNKISYSPTSPLGDPPWLLGHARAGVCRSQIWRRLQHGAKPFLWGKRGPPGWCMARHGTAASKSRARHRQLIPWKPKHPHAPAHRVTRVGETAPPFLRNALSSCSLLKIFPC